MTIIEITAKLRSYDSHTMNLTPVTPVYCFKYHKCPAVLVFVMAEIVLLTVIVLFLPLLASADNAIVPMPRKFENVFLGMTEKQMQESRKSAERIKDFPGEESENKEYTFSIYTEQIKDSMFFKQAIYLFFNDNLCRVSFLGKHLNQTNLKRFLHGAIKKWGKDYNKFVYSLSKFDIKEEEILVAKTNKIMPLLLWRINEIELRVTYSQPDDKPGKTIASDEIKAGLTITRNDCFPEFIRAHPLIATQTQNLSPVKGESNEALFEMLNEQVTPPLFG